MTDEQRAQEILDMLSDARESLQRVAIRAMPQTARELVRESLTCVNMAINHILDGIAE